MSSVGFYRFKTTADVAKTLDWTVNYIVQATKNVEPVITCQGDLILKYLDLNGQFRFYPFNKFYETLDEPKKIGSVNRFLVDIADDQSNTQNVGYTNNRSISVSQDVPDEELAKLKDIYVSPRVYLYIGETTDLKKDWLEVEVKAATPIVRRRKASTGRVDLTITLPEQYTIKMI